MAWNTFTVLINLIFFISLPVDGILGQLNNLDTVDNSAINKKENEVLRYVDFESSDRIQIVLG